MPNATVTALTDVISIAGGHGHSLAVAADGTLWGWGNNSLGQVGDGTTTNRNAPVQVGVATNWTAVACGSYHSVALNSSGEVYCWGRNYEGQCGISGTGFITTPALVTMPETVSITKIAAGGNSSLFGDMLSLRKVYGCGKNDKGQIGGSNLSQVTTPVEIGHFANTDHIAAGHDFTVAVRQGAVLVAGFAEYPKQSYSGYGIVLSSSDFHTIATTPAGQNFLSISASRSACFAVTETGDVFGFTTTAETPELGKYTDGTQFGWRTSVYNSAYAQADWSQRTDAPLAAKVAAGYDHLFILGQDGYLYSYGRNDFGQLGRTTTTDAEKWAVTKLESAGGGWNNVACGEHHSLMTVSS